MAVKQQLCQISILLEDTQKIVKSMQVVDDGAAALQLLACSCSVLADTIEIRLLLLHGGLVLILKSLLEVGVISQCLLKLRA
jgi:hypothetical protein